MIIFTNSIEDDGNIRYDDIVSLESTNDDKTVGKGMYFVNKKSTALVRYGDEWRKTPLKYNLLIHPSRLFTPTIKSSYDRITNHVRNQDTITDGVWTLLNLIHSVYRHDSGEAVPIAKMCTFFFVEFLNLQPLKTSYDDYYRSVKAPALDTTFVYYLGILDQHDGIWCYNWKSRVWSKWVAA